MSTPTDPRQAEPQRFARVPVPRYLSRTEVAQRLGLKSVRSLSGINLPPHDVEVGTHKGWTVQTIDDWNAARPGKGWHRSR